MKNKESLSLTHRPTTGAEIRFKFTTKIGTHDFPKKNSGGLGAANDFLKELIDILVVNCNTHTLDPNTIKIVLGG